MWRVPHAIPCTVARYNKANCFSLVSRVKPQIIPFAFGSAIGDLHHHKLNSLKL
uniref:FGGY carbohydrate kinase domain-containing protein isoform X2 n=1 Tax=Rhizophora mucronata TaxID=61149 RepID=A0A2P2M1G5_RHIMU